MVRKSRTALQDLYKHAVFIGQESTEAALRFLASADATFDRIAANPGIGHRRDDLEPPYDKFRVLSIDGFSNHLVFYREDKDGVTVLRVIHGARDLGSALTDE